MNDYNGSLLDQDFSDSEKDIYQSLKYGNCQTALNEIYLDTINDIDNEIDKYYNNVEKIWDSVILEYKNNLSYGIILDKLNENDKSKFYELMRDTPVIMTLFETRKRLCFLVNKGNKKIQDKT